MAEGILRIARRGHLLRQARVSGDGRTSAGCDIAVNPIVAGAAQSITNKIGDYAAAGLPVVNSQECPEYRDLLVAYGAGISCEPTADAVAAALVELAQDRNLVERGMGSRRMAEERFDRAVTYERLGGVVRPRPELKLLTA